jgi:DNA-directed RNA polymerase specialized sigma24 family protein
VQKDEIERVVSQLRTAEQIYRSALKERDQTVQRLAKVHGYSAAEIARTVGVSPAHAGIIVRKGR